MTEFEISHSRMVTQLAKPAVDILRHLEQHPEQLHAWHMATGVSGEAGELLDAVKKHVVYAKDADINNIIVELGDLEFYMEGLRQHFDITRETTLKANEEKLMKGKNARYASGSYSDEQAQNRADKAQDPLMSLTVIRHSNPETNGMTRDCVHYALSSMNLNEYALYFSGGSWKHSASIRNEWVLAELKAGAHLGPLKEELT